MRLPTLAAAPLLLAVIVACTSTPSPPPSGEAPPPPVEATSLLGSPLERIEPPAERRALHERELAAARERWRAAGEEDDAIWVGRQLAYLGRYREAIDWFDARLEDFPTSVRLRRHRGHRFLSVRQIDDAIADLEAAWELARGTPDQIEPDGLPNERGIPRSTTHDNILYHLGLAHWLAGDPAAAEATWAQAVAASSNDDMLVASLNWQVHALRRLGREDEARHALEAVRPEMDVIENDVYHRILLLQKGELTPNDVLNPAAADGVQDATAAYGLSLWHLANGESAEAEVFWRRIVEETPWNAFGHLGAEAELARGA